MSSWCQEILSSIEDDSSWKASITFPSSIWHTSDFYDEIRTSPTYTPTETIPTSSTTSIIDIIQLFNQTLKIQKKILQTSIRMNYPKSAIFHFEDYESLSDKDSLIRAIKKSASSTGTYLITKSTKRNVGVENNYEIDLTCKHYGLPKKSTSKDLHFNAHSLQASHTIIQPQHSASSTKNFSRSRFLKRVTNNNDEEDKSKLNKCTTIKCGCSFIITIFFHVPSQKWYLKKRITKNNIQYHTKHIWIDPIHNYTHKKDLSQIVIDSILELIQGGSNDANIKIFVYSKYKIHVTVSLVYNMRVKHIQHIIDICAEDPTGNAVDRLISLFKHTPDVSCVYLLHKYDSGFVRYRKNKKKIDTDIINQDKIGNDFGYSSTSIKNWRDSIKLSNSNDVLVAFAWAHDDEIRNTEMFPELLGMDVTFGVNLERRELLLAGGIDGNKKAFTAFRCLIPSKQEQTYTWIINEAMSFLLTPKTLKFNSCISTDQEFSLNTSVNTSISSSKSSFKHSKLRLDCYHFYRKVWSERIHPCAKRNTQSKPILHTLDKWIMSWFKYIESSQEFDISLKYFTIYLESIQSIIGQFCVEQIIELKTKMIGKKEFLFHHHFLTITNFDYLGDSFIEALNQSIKRGPIAVNSRMDMSNSAFTQLKGTTVKSMKRNLDGAKYINTKNLWSQSRTSSYLTPYAEGIMCDIFDRKSQYINIRSGPMQWMVVHKESLNICIEKQWNSKDINKKIRFTRVRKVTIDKDGFMNCSCHFPSRWLLPCSHICHIIDKVEYLTPELIHIRWWKHFNYLYKNPKTNTDFGTKKAISDTLDMIRSTHYHEDTGQHKGIPMQDNMFLKGLKSNLFCFEDYINHEYYDIIKAIDKMKMTDGMSLIQGSDYYLKYTGVSNDNSIEDTTDFDRSSSTSFETNDSAYIISESIDNLGAGSQVQISLSQQRTSMDEDTYSKKKKRKKNNTDVDDSLNTYQTLYPLFVEITNNIKSREDLQEAVSAFEKIQFQLKAQTLTGNNKNNNETSFLGEIIGPRRIEKRHKTWNEKRK